AARTRARDKANSHFIFVPPSEPARILPQHALDGGGKRNGLEMRVAELLISIEMERIVRFWVTSGTAHRRRAREVGYVRCAVSSHALQNFKDWKSAAACDHRSRFWTGRPQPCARQRRCRAPYRVRRVRNTTSRWPARG